MDTESTAQIFERYRGGDERAAEELFTRYMERLTALARSRLSPSLAVRTDAEDIVMSAYRSFFVGAREGQFSLQRSGDLWRLLASITLHKLFREARRHRTQGRSIDAELPINDEELFGREPSPDEVVGMADELEALFARLDFVSRRVLELRLQDASLAAISKATGRSERTIRRMLADIRALLLQQADRST